MEKGYKSRTERMAIPKASNDYGMMKTSNYYGKTTTDARIFKVLSKDQGDQSL